MKWMHLPQYAASLPPLLTYHTWTKNNQDSCFIGSHYQSQRILTKGWHGCEVKHEKNNETW